MRRPTTGSGPLSQPLQGKRLWGGHLGKWWELAPASSGFESRVDGEKCLGLSPSWLQSREGWGERLGGGDTNFPRVGVWVLVGSSQVSAMWGSPVSLSLFPSLLSLSFFLSASDV